MKNIWLPLLLFLLALPCRAQLSPQAETLFACFRNAAGFNDRTPREMVYLHLDNNGYFEDETIWFRAYVVRAAGLQSLPLSGVLYVDLLDAGGRLVEQLTLHPDSLGRAEGSFSLKLPVKSGFYEVRAYTREMVNWGSEACYSRIVPVFSRPGNRKKPIAPDEIDPENLQIARPAANAAATLGTPRLVRTDSTTRNGIHFFPEGGSRVQGVEQRIAFQLEGRGVTDKPDSIALYDADGIRLGLIPTLHADMGLFTLPAEAGDAYVQWRGERFPLPEAAEGAQYVLTVQPTTQSVNVRIAGNGEALRTDSLLGLVATCRGAVCYFDTLHLAGAAVEMELPLTALHGGVNQLTLVSPTGRTLARRAVWRDAPMRQLDVQVRQNAATYEPFAPIVLDVSVHDAAGRPVSTDFSLSVRAADSEFTRPNDGGAAASLLLSSEIRGYIHRPQDYFPADTPERRAALDLLLMVQGWTANTFEQMALRDTFDTPQPIEEHLTLNGILLHDNERRQPYPGVQLSLKMYSRQGGGLEARTVTDEEGRFAFVSNVDYEGDFIAQFRTTNAVGKTVRSRVAVDRWFSPPPADFGPAELLVLPPESPTAAGEGPGAAQLFAWADTIPREVKYHLHEATVKGRRKYRGFTGNRYTYNGGEEAGMRQGEIFINLAREVERYKDAGGDPGYIFDFLALLDRNAELRYVAESDATAGQGDPTHAYPYTTPDEGQATDAGELPDDPEKTITWHGRSTHVLLNNDEVSLDLSEAPAEWFKSVAIAPGNRLSKLRDLQPGEQTPDYLILLYEKPNACRKSSAKGVEKRNVKGYTTPQTFYHPDYRRRDLPSEADARRTLAWQPTVKTDENGHATVILYNNGTPDQQLRITLRGVTPRGEFLDWGE